MKIHLIEVLFVVSFMDHGIYIFLSLSLWNFLVFMRDLPYFYILINILLCIISISVITI